MKLPVPIYPGFFKAKPVREGPRAGAGPSRLRVKATVTRAPSSPRAKYAMPVIVIVAAVASFVGGMAIATAAGATIAAMVVGGAMMVGAALTIVGTITDRPNLVKWGGILSLAGGLGAGVLGLAGGLTAAGTAAESTATEAGALVNAGDAEQALANQTVAGGGVTTPVAETPGLLSTAGNAAEPEVPQPAPAPTAPPAAPVADSAPLTPGATDALKPQTASSFSTAAPASPDAFTTQAPAPVTDATTPVAGTANGSSTGFFDNAGRWIRSNPELSRAAFNATGLLASSLIPKPLTVDQRAKANLDQANADRLNPNSSWWRQQPRAGG